MARADIWMPFYVADYLADTMHLSAAEHGAYLMLILHYWRNGPIPNDPERLANISRLGNAWSNASSTLLAFFEQRDGMLIHHRIDQEKADAEGNKERNKARAQAAAAKRWAGNASSNAHSNAEAVLDECPSPSPSQLTSKTKPKAPNGAARAKPARFDPASIDLPSCIPADAWASWIAYRRKRKLTTAEETVTAQAAKLAEWHRSGHDPTKIIEASITNGWQGLFEPKTAKGFTSYDDKLQSTADALTGRYRLAGGEAGRTLAGSARTLD